MFALPYGSHSLAAGALSTATIPEEDSDGSDDGVLCLDGSMPLMPVAPEDFEADYEQAEQAGLSMALHQQAVQEGGEEDSLESHLVLMDLDDADSDGEDEGGLAAARAAAAKRAAARAPAQQQQQQRGAGGSQRRSGGPDSRIRHLSERLRNVGSGKQRGGTGGAGSPPPVAML
jgi:hypothetical protein